MEKELLEFGVRFTGNLKDPALNKAFDRMCEVMKAEFASFLNENDAGFFIRIPESEPQP